jgi:hypothetical protein
MTMRNLACPMGVIYSELSVTTATMNLGYKDTAGTSIFGVLISEGPYKQPRITKNNLGRDMLWGVPISGCSYIGGPYNQGSLYILHG